jgi:hypothetical protein
VIPSLGPEARALLDRAREGMTPDAAAVRRVRGKIGASAAGAGGLGLAVKLGMLLVGAVFVAGVGFSMRSSREAAVAPRVELADREARPATVARETEVAREAEPPAQPAAAALVDPATPTAAHRARATDADSHATAARGTDDAAASATRAPAVAPTATLAREVELIDLAMASLRRGDAKIALAAVQRHATETGGRGQLAEDAAAIEIEALCKLHDPSTAAKLDAFDARWPDSAQRSRLKSTCP